VGESHEGSQRDQENIERIDEELFAERRHRPLVDDAGGEERQRQ